MSVGPQDDDESDDATSNRGKCLRRCSDLICQLLLHDYKARLYEQFDNRGEGVYFY